MYYFYNRSGKGLGRGVSSMIARLIGAKDYENINDIPWYLYMENI